VAAGKAAEYQSSRAPSRTHGRVERRRMSVTAWGGADRLHASHGGIVPRRDRWEGGWLPSLYLFLLSVPCGDGGPGYAVHHLVWHGLLSADGPSAAAEESRVTTAFCWAQRAFQR